MKMLDDIKIALRISNTNFDDEINNLIDAAKLDLEIAGVTVIDETDALIKRAVTMYVKANFGWDNPDMEKLNAAYTTLKQHLVLCGDYNAVE